MKKLISVVLALVMISGLFTFPAAADTDGYYLNEDFEKGAGNFVATNSNVSLTVVPSTTEGVGGNGNVLKVTSNAADSTNVGAFGADVNFATPIPVNEKLVFETRIKAPNNAGSYKYLFAISSGNRGKCYGLARLAIPGGGINYYSVNPSSNSRWDATNPLKDDSGNIVTLSTTDWYRIKVVYNNGTIETMELYSDAGTLLASGDYTNHSTQNHAYPPAQIDLVRFAQAAADTIYLDEVKIYKYVEEEAFAVASSFSGMLPTDSLEIEIPFNKDIDEDTISGVSITGVDAADPVIASRAADGSTLKLTLKEMLIPSATYTIDLSGVKSSTGKALGVSTVTAYTASDSASSGASYLNEDFEDGMGDFVTTDSTNVKLSVVSASEAGGLGGKGNVLKFENVVGTNVSAYGADVNFATAIPVDKPLVFETRIYAPSNTGSHKYLFALYGGTRNKIYGLARLVVPGGGLNYYSVNGSSATRYDVSNPLKDTSGNTVTLNTTDWYKIRIIYDNGTIKTLSLYDKADTLLASASDLPTQNDPYHVAQIDSIRFSQEGAATIYLDDVKIYEYVETDPLSFVDASIAEGEEVSPADVDSVTLNFSGRIDINTLDKFAVTADGSAVDYTAKLVGDSKKVEITFTDGLIGGADYVVDYSAVKDINGSSASGAFSFSAKEGLFVKDITFVNDNIAQGATIKANVGVLNYTGDTSKVSFVAAVYEEINGAIKMRNVNADIDKDVVKGKSDVEISVAIPADAVVGNTSVGIFALEDMSGLKPLISASFIGKK